MPTSSSPWARGSDCAVSRGAQAPGPCPKTRAASRSGGRGWPIRGKTCRSAAAGEGPSPFGATSPRTIREATAFSGWPGLRATNFGCLPLRNHDTAGACRKGHPFSPLPAARPSLHEWCGADGEKACASRGQQVVVQVGRLAEASAAAALALQFAVVGDGDLTSSGVKRGDHTDNLVATPSRSLATMLLSIALALVMVHFATVHSDSSEC